MKERDTLNKLIDDGAVTTTLRKGSSARHAIAALQTLLHWLGFDRELKWEKFGADGDYGMATTAAVAGFARRNGSTANGERVIECSRGEDSGPLRLPGRVEAARRGCRKEKDRETLQEGRSRPHPDRHPADASERSGLRQGTELEQVRRRWGLRTFHYCGGGCLRKTGRCRRGWQGTDRSTGRAHRRPAQPVLRR